VPGVLNVVALVWSKVETRLGWFADPVHAVELTISGGVQILMP